MFSQSISNLAVHQHELDVIEVQCVLGRIQLKNLRCYFYRFFGLPYAFKQIHVDSQVIKFHFTITLLQYGLEYAENKRDVLRMLVDLFLKLAFKFSQVQLLLIWQVFLLHRV